MVLTSHPALEGFLSFLSAQEREYLLQLLKHVQVAAGDTLFRSRDEADNLYLVLEGRLAVRKNTGVGDRTQVVALLTAGAIAGEAAITSGMQRGATVLAVEDCELAVLSHQSMAKIEKEQPVLANSLLKKILSIVCLRLQKSSERLALVL